MKRKKRRSKRQDTPKQTYRCAKYVYHRIPRSLKIRWTDYLKKLCQAEMTEKDRKNFILELQLNQIHRMLLGILVSCGIFIACLIGATGTKPLVFERNRFGKGDKEIALTVEKGKQSEEISLILSEQKVSEEEINKIFASFFKELQKQMAGENASLLKVNQSLHFADCVDGYPFEIVYEPEEPELIDWNGNLGEEGIRLSEKEKRKTYIRVQASYGEYEAEKQFSICLIPQEKTKPTFIQKWKTKLEEQEAASREDAVFQIEAPEDGVVITDLSSQETMAWKLPMFILLLVILLCFRDYSLLKEKRKNQHKENMEDFPLIVHLMTLYMSAGLSFSSMIERICSDYEKNPQNRREKRFAFEQIQIMNHQIHMGVRPKEACLTWGNRFAEQVYGKLAMILSQSLSKGAKEVRIMMEREQKDAFQIQVDYVRKCAEEASTKLLFPMICLLFIIMVLIIFPALMQFQGF